MMLAPSLTSEYFIRLWERCLGLHSVDRALTLMAAFSGEGFEKCAEASVGVRDAALLRICERIAGPNLDAFAECPACGERLEYSLRVRELLAADPGPDRAAEVMLEADGFSLRLRVPNSLDLATVAGCADASTARDLLIQRCVREARSGSVDIPVTSIPASVIEQAEDRLAQADPMAELSIDLNCSACGHAWQVLLDVESFLWAKLGSLAKRLLREVHVLARAYGWSEADTLSLSPARREFYLQMVS